MIIGGSHSGFSAAWMLLNGPADIMHNTHVKPSVQYDVNDKNMPFRFPDAVFKTSVDCPKCCGCKKKPCTCICKCFSFFRYEDIPFNYEELPNFAEGSIKILYRDQIKVFYPRVKQAESEGYKDFK